MFLKFKITGKKFVAYILIDKLLKYDLSRLIDQKKLNKKIILTEFVQRGRKCMMTYGFTKSIEK